MRFFKSRDPAVKKADDIFVHIIEGFFSVEKLDELAVEPCQAPQIHRPIGIWAGTAY
jgi:hypothetical protein